jgi:Tol biopolymer transport system component
VLDDVAYAATTSGAAQFAFSPSGALLYRKRGVASAMATLEWVDSAGKREPLRAKRGSYAEPRVSPDGKRVAMQVTDGSGPDIRVYEPQRDAFTRLTFGGADYRNPVWSPDGQFVVFYSGGNGIFWARSDGAGQPQLLLASQEPMLPSSFPADGKRLAYFQVAGLQQIWTVPVEEDGGKLKAGKSEQFLKSQFNYGRPALSRDGHWLAYQSNASGDPEVYVRAFPDNGSQWPISNSGGTNPVWSRASHELLYQSGDRIMAASYTVKGATFVTDSPHVWLDKLGGTDWDLAPDGKQLVVVSPVQKQQSEAPQQDHTVVLLLNFFDYLRQRVPLDK